MHTSFNQLRMGALRHAHQKKRTRCKRRHEQGPEIQCRHWLGLRRASGGLRVHEDTKLVRGKGLRRLRLNAETRLARGRASRGLRLTDWASVRRGKRRFEAAEAHCDWAGVRRGDQVDRRETARGGSKI